jgi:transcriptional regulator with XRE-family HTH domain
MEQKVASTVIDTSLPLGERIKAFTRKRGINTNAFASLCGLSVRVLHRFENGEKIRSVSLEKIERVLNGEESVQPQVVQRHSTFDETTERFIQTILALPKSREQKAMLLTDLFNRWSAHIKDPETEDRFIEDLFRLYLKLEAPRDRLAELLQLWKSMESEND